ncbi:MAG: 3-phosphoshikimate 1-carboxyvinyltransferase [Acidimicrobiia bacterium]
MSARTVRGPGGVFRARLRVPGDKSLSHRALLLAGMARGESELQGLGPGRDVQSTKRLLEALGVQVGEGWVRSGGVDLWEAPATELDAGNSATTVRLMAGALAGRSFTSTLVGDDSLMARPMDRLAGPLEALGARVWVSEGGTPPVVVGGSGPLHGAEVWIAVASAQVRSAVELAALQAEGESLVDSPPGFRDHTERWLAALGLGERRSATAFRVVPGRVPPASYPIPGDPSSAAFLWAAAALVPGAEVLVEQVSLNPGRTGFCEVLEHMGVEVETRHTGEVHGDPVGDVRVRGAPLSGTAVDGELATRSLDELPLVAVLAGCAEGPTTIGDAGELRVKESNRITTAVNMVRALGGEAHETHDGFVVGGGRIYRGGTVEAGGDHRIAMAAAVAASASTGPVTIEGAQAAEVSWPGFYEALEGVWSSP